MNPQTMEKLYAAMQDSKGMPALESNVTSILNSLKDDEQDHQGVVGHIVEDFTLTQKVLKLANSQMYAPFADKTVSVSSALDVLGSDGLLHLVLGTRMINVADLAEDEHLSKTLLASEVARNVCPDRLEDASIAAMMYDLGNLIASRYLPDEVAAIRSRVNNGADPESAAEEVLGMTMQQLGLEIGKHWRLPAEITSIIDGSGDRTLVDIAKFSTTVSSLIHEKKAEEANALVSKFDVPGMDKSRLASLVLKKVEEISQRGSTIKLVSSELILSQLVATLAEEKKKTVDELAGSMFPILSHELDTAHCLLFMMAKSGDFCIRAGYGKGIEELKSKLRISAEYMPTAFHAAIQNKADISITDVSKLKATALPDAYRQLLPNVRRLLILPIANSRVTGLLYCDWESSKKELKPAELAVVRKLRDLFLSFFPR